MIKPPKSKFMKIVDDANRLHLKNDLERAKEKYLEALVLSPDNSLILWKLGDICIGLNQFDHAAVYYSRLEILNPGDVSIINNFAHCLIKINAHDSAEKVLNAALKIDSNDIATHLNLTVLACAKFDYDKALFHAKNALLIAPNSAIAHNNLGSAFQKLGNDDLAAYQYETATLIDPNYFDPKINLAGLLCKLGRVHEAIELYENLLKRKDLSHESEIRIKQALAAEYLTIGNLDLGWKYYELGLHPIIDFEMSRSPKRVFDVPRWNGENLGNKTILVWGEQGIGDELLFLTCLPDLCKLTKNIIVECQSRIVSEIARSFPDIQVRASSYNSDVGFTQKYNDFDLQIPMGSLPLIFRKKIEDFNFSGPYIMVSKDKAEEFENRLSVIDNSKIRVGICWRSGFQNAERNISYSQIKEWSPIFNNKNLEFINLQYGDCEQELNSVENDLGVKILRWDDLDLKNDFKSTLALISRLDFVITAATAVHTMAAGVGVKTILMSSYGWTNVGTNYYPWFPNVEFVSASDDFQPKPVSNCIPKVAKLFNNNLTN